MERESEYGAFMEKFILKPSSTSQELPLNGLTFAVKDIFDMDGYVTGFGNPDWARTHSVASSTAPTVLAVLRAGATCVGKTVMDEMAYSINGENKHYGTPTNPCAPDRVPGGSSSGSAVAVGAMLVDFSLGTDTGGSVRVPGAYCGVFGFRPSHGVVSTSGVIPMAQSFDTVGWFSRDPVILNQVGRVLLQLPDEEHVQPSQIVIAEDCFKLLSFPSDRVTKVLTKSTDKLFGGHILSYASLGNYIENEVASLKPFMVKGAENQEFRIESLVALSNAMRLLQRYEFKNNHGEWVNTVKPDLGPGLSERVWEALSTTEENIDVCHSVKTELRAALSALLGDVDIVAFFQKRALTLYLGNEAIEAKAGSFRLCMDFGILVIPTVPGPPPKLQTEASALETFRVRAFSLLSIAGVSGFCQVTIPLGMYDNLPVAISLLAKHGADGFLLNLVETLYGTVKEEIEIAEKLSY